MHRDRYTSNNNAIFNHKVNGKTPRTAALSQTDILLAKLTLQL